MSMCHIRIHLCKDCAMHRHYVSKAAIKFACLDFVYLFPITKIIPFIHEKDKLLTKKIMCIEWKNEYKSNANDRIPNVFEYNFHRIIIIILFTIGILIYITPKILNCFNRLFTSIHEGI